MAEGWARKLKSNLIAPYSAGIETHGLNQNAIAVMAEVGVDISRHRSKHLEDFKEVVFDYVVTVCDNARESCPVYLGPTKTIHRGFDDPPSLAKDASTKKEALAHYRRVRDEIRDFVKTLPESLQSTEE